MSCNTETNRGPNITPDKNIKYTGPEIVSLGLCPGMYLDEVEAAIIAKLVDYATGVGISLPDTDFTSCSFLESFISCCAADKSLQGLINTIFKGFCTIDTEITDIHTLITTIQHQIDYTIVPGCLTTTDNKIDTVLNKLILEYCNLVVKLNTIFGSIDNPVINNTIITNVTDTVIANVFSNIRGCAPGDVTKTGSGLSTVITINGAVPIKGIVFGEWDATYFDSTGLGLASKGMCGWAECNGNNGTTDWRGFGPAMATNISSSLSLNTKVDPFTNLDADYATNIGDIKGEVKHLNTIAEMAAHSHTAITAPHHHSIPIGGGLNQDGNSGNPEKCPTNSRAGNPQSMDTTDVSLSIAVSTTGGGVKAENRQPTRYVNCIMRIA